MRPLPEEVVALMRRMRSSGVGVDDVASTVGVSRWTVIKYCKSTTRRLRCTNCLSEGHRRPACPQEPVPVANPGASAYARRHKAAGLCVSCPRKAEPGLSRCGRCAEVERNRRSR